MRGDMEKTGSQSGAVPPVQNDSEGGKGWKMPNITYPVLVWDASACNRMAGRSTMLVPLNGITPWAIGAGERDEQYGEALAEAATYEEN